MTWSGPNLPTDHVTEHSIQVHYRASVSKKTVVVRSRYVRLDASSARLTTAARRTLRIRKQSIAATDGDPVHVDAQIGRPATPGRRGQYPRPLALVPALAFLVITLPDGAITYHRPPLRLSAWPRAVPGDASAT